MWCVEGSTNEKPVRPDLPSPNHSSILSPCYTPHTPSLTSSGWHDPLLRIKHQHLDKGWIFKEWYANLTQTLFKLFFENEFLCTNIKFVKREKHTFLNKIKKYAWYHFKNDQWCTAITTLTCRNKTKNNFNLYEYLFASNSSYAVKAITVNYWFIHTFLVFTGVIICHLLIIPPL